MMKHTRNMVGALRREEILDQPTSALGSAEKLGNVLPRLDYLRICRIGLEQHEKFKSLRKVGIDRHDDLLADPSKIHIYGRY